MKRYKFLRLVDNQLKSEYGNFVWEVGKWYKHEGDVETCTSGFHCSKKIGQAFSYVQGEVLAEVEVKGNVSENDDKEAWSEMKINKVWLWEKKNSVAMSIFSAELCLDNYEKVYPNEKAPRLAIEAAKRWLLEPTEANESAARSAAWSAESAAWSAARSAARSAAWSAASAARSAARSAAWSAASAAESAAESAASAAWSAARSAVIKKIHARFDEELKVLKPYDKK